MVTPFLQLIERDGDTIFVFCSWSAADLQLICSWSVRSICLTGLLTLSRTSAPQQARSTLNVLVRHNLLFIASWSHFQPGRCLTTFQAWDSPTREDAKTRANEIAFCCWFIIHLSFVFRIGFKPYLQLASVGQFLLYFFPVLSNKYVPSFVNFICETQESWPRASALEVIGSSP